MTIGVKLAAWEHKYGNGEPIEYDHRPPLSERQFDPETNDTVPPTNDPRFIEPITRKEHDIRTNGLGGEKRITTAGSDAHRRSKVRALTKAQEEFRRRILAKDGGDPKPRQSKWPKRKIQSRKMGT